MDQGAYGWWGKFSKGIITNMTCMALSNKRGHYKELGEWRTSAIAFSYAFVSNVKAPAQVLLAQLMVEQDSN